jgi:hypothetical protein
MGGKFPVLHGEPTPLQNALSRIKQSRLINGYVWTYAELEVLVQLYPPPDDLRVEDLPPGETPWKYPWVPRTDLYKPADVQKIVRESRFVLILREQADPRALPRGLRSVFVSAFCSITFVEG